MHLTWTGVLAIASPLIALVSAFFALRSIKIARKSLDLSYKTAQANYEVSKNSSTPVVGLFLTGIEYRKPVAGETRNYIVNSMTCKSHIEFEPDSLEVVVRGRLVNNTQHEILLTCRHHPNCGRTIYYSLRNQSVFIIGGTEVYLGRAVLPEGQEVTFEWIDRRPKSDWIDIYNLHTENFYNDPECRLPRLTWYEIVHALCLRRSLYLARREKVKRSGFLLVCESRIEERVATILRAEVVKPPIETGGRGEDGRVFFEEWLGTLPGPLDDSVLLYRIGFDSTLALINPSRRGTVAGRL